ncbi:MAG: HAD hydrolase-like protein [Planctomycetaceae bacterium]|nr:HAD hydrolase-like protein [Planctomycetaceae bacterium]
MAQTLTEYLASIDERSDLIWPAPPDAVAIKVTPFTQPLPGIKVVLWNVYGTLLRIDQGELLHVHSQKLRMQIALEKTIKEFNMWYSMSRKPGQPWESLLRQYTDIVEEVGMTSTKRKGDYPDISSHKIWRKIFDRLVKNEYDWDQGTLGSLDALVDKVAFFFHASLQGTAAAPHATETLLQLIRQGTRCGVLADSQSFTLPQLFRDLRKQEYFESNHQVLTPDCLFLSSDVGLRKPSPTFFEKARDSLRDHGFSPDEVLHVSHLLQEDLAVAKSTGFHTCLYVSDKNTCRFQAADVRDPDLKPDRLISEICQVRDIVGA